MLYLIHQIKQYKIKYLIIINLNITNIKTINTLYIQYYFYEFYRMIP